MRRLAITGVALALAGCAGQPLTPIADGPAVPAHDAMYTPQRVGPGRLEYAPDRDTFAPILTTRGPFPTQQQANDAYQRALGAPTYGPAVITGTVRGRHGARRVKMREAVVTAEPRVIAAPELVAGASAAHLPASIRLFACKPGALDSQTARIYHYNGPVVHCATDFLDAAGAPVKRETVNFAYYDRAWHMDFTNPPGEAVRWAHPTFSPKDPWRWFPFRGRYE